MLILGQDDVADLLDTDALIDALAAAMADLSAGRAVVPARTGAALPGHPATMLVDMPAYVPSTRALISKLVSVFPGNAGGPDPVRQGVMLVFDPDTGAPAALMDATWITAARTGACSALSTRLLAREDASVLAVLGTGPQARAHALAAVRVRPIREIRVAGRDHTRSSAFAQEIAREPATTGTAVRATASYQEAVEGADVVCAATYADEPVVRRPWIAPGTHITSVGYNPRGRELDDATVTDALLFVESRSAALSAVPPNRDLADPIDSGLITPGHVRAELGELVAGTAAGRGNDAQITLYKSVGVAVQDAAAAALVLAAARERGVGRKVSL
ncbi:ornithine cyclodeaminase family protein [Streptomyces sp. NA02950]|uniref:ornithine cyclodeaminase family protein n=1 Tax=Streptomyces sp. NA02950 TaxID=2742137 RepID=UPI0015905865|nr:ornithine cyclodeaminase family protein [Streptomyces sp. NA02950]QKV96625.1 ornithine cyclodeaminase family protein [Streptomyces sp. NA02950]